MEFLFTELVWSQLKGYIASKNVKSRSLKDMKNLVIDAFASVSNIRYIIEYQWLFNI